MTILTFNERKRANNERARPQRGRGLFSRSHYHFPQKKVCRCMADFFTNLRQISAKFRRIFSDTFLILHLKYLSHQNLRNFEKNSCQKIWTNYRFFARICFLSWNLTKYLTKCLLVFQLLYSLDKDSYEFADDGIIGIIMSIKIPMKNPA